jgi:uncharacterized protein (TIGR03067 family)
MRFRLLLVVLAVLPLSFAPAPFPRRTKSKPLNGTWQRVSYVRGGWRFPNAALEIVISHDRVYYPHNNGGILEAVLVVNDTTNPRTFDLRDANPRSRWHYLGIYRLDGDTLVLCSTAVGVGPRPRAFSGAPGQNHLEVFKRKKP